MDPVVATPREILFTIFAALVIATVAWRKELPFVRRRPDGPKGFRLPPMPRLVMPVVRVVLPVKVLAAVPLRFHVPGPYCTLPAMLLVSEVAVLLSCTTPVKTVVPVPVRVRVRALAESPWVMMPLNVRLLPVPAMKLATV